MAEPGNERKPSSRSRTARASGRSVEIAVARALAELDFAPGELTEDQYAVTVKSQAEEGFLGVGGTDALVEVSLLLGDDERDESGSVRDGEGPRRDADNQWADEGADDESPAWRDDGSDIPEAGSARLRAFLSVVLNGLGVKATVRLVEEVDTLRADVAGEDLGVFIGRRGQTIDAIEYLASLALYPHPESRKRVEIDAEGYKQRRRDTIEQVAFRSAQEAARRGRPVELEPMTPAERKIVHLALKDRRDVITESRGREPNRAVVIVPTP
ncbi:MAG: RNA-binding cell elongation regulator Jag/EloR [Thermoleophilia bacterium]